VLKYFWEMIGEINFCGYGPAFIQRLAFWKALSGTDELSDNPLSINGPDLDHINIEMDGEEYFYVGGDATTKSNISGSILTMSLEDADSVFVRVYGEIDFEKRKTVPTTVDDYFKAVSPSLISLIRQSFEYGGFPGFSPVFYQSHPALPKVLNFLSELSRGLLLI